MEEILQEKAHFLKEKIISVQDMIMKNIKLIIEVEIQMKIEGMNIIEAK